MRYALSDDGTKIEATPREHATCPTCTGRVRAKCGSVVVWHWAHIAQDDCDTWTEPDTEWHRVWQEIVAPEYREVIIGRHRADIRTRHGVVVELQRSAISMEEIRERENFYDNMIWIFDVRDAVAMGRLDIRKRSNDLRSTYRTFRWKHARKTLAACRRPVYLDLGDERMLRMHKMHSDTPCGGWGHINDTTRMREWLRA